MRTMLLASAVALMGAAPALAHHETRAAGGSTTTLRVLNAEGVPEMAGHGQDTETATTAALAASGSGQTTQASSRTVTAAGLAMHGAPPERYPVCRTRAQDRCRVAR